MGTTSTFLKKRVSKPTLGKWSSGFSAVKKYAESNNVPLIAVWSNGDACGHCVNFEKSIMESAFTTWQASSKCVFWFGCSSDKTADDKFEGTGFTWARNKKLTQYPFVRVYWKGGKVDTYKSGDDWTGGKATGGATFVKKLKDLLKNYKPTTTTTTVPEPTPAPTPTPEPETPVCEGGNCGTCEDCECDELKEKVEELTSKVKELTTKVDELTDENADLRVKIATFKEKWSKVFFDIDELDKAVNSI